MKPTKEQLISLIEDYAMAKTTGRPTVAAPFAQALSEAIEKLFALEPPTETP